MTTDPAAPVCTLATVLLSCCTRSAAPSSRAPTPASTAAASATLRFRPRSPNCRGRRHERLSHHLAWLPPRPGGHRRCVGDPMSDLSSLASECHEDVTRKGESRPCDKPAVAARIDPTEGNPYPVCAKHARGLMVPLASLLAAAPPDSALATGECEHCHRPYYHLKACPNSWSSIRRPESAPTAEPGAEGGA
jgi:hypothetical protein